jgi:hypothetical protein
MTSKKDEYIFGASVLAGSGRRRAEAVHLQVEALVPGDERLLHGQLLPERPQLGQLLTFARNNEKKIIVCCLQKKWKFFLLHSVVLVPGTFVMIKKIFLPKITHELDHNQGCQMVYYQTKNPNLGNFLRALD